MRKLAYIKLNHQPAFASLRRGKTPCPARSAVPSTLGQLGGDGILWKVLPDGATPDVTPRVAGKAYYTFDVGAEKYHPYIHLTTSTTNANLDTDVPEVCVGQQVTFALDWTPSAPPYQEQVGRWVLPPKYVNESWQQVRFVHDDNYPENPYQGHMENYGSVNYRISNDLLTNLSTQCWYVNQPGGKVKAGWNLQFPNGQQAVVTAKGSFTVYRPSVAMVPFTSEEGYRQYFTYPWGLIGINPACKVKYGTDDEAARGSMQYRVRVTTTNDFDGCAGITQLCDLDYSAAGWQCQNNLDGADEIYHGTWGIYARYNSNTNLNQVPFLDTPEATWWTPNQMKGSFRDYVRFCPDGSGNIFVTLGIITWNMNAVAEREQLTGTWGLTTDEHPAPSGPDGSEQFPEWTLKWTGFP